MRNRYGVPYSSDLSSRSWGGAIEGITIEHMSATDAEVPSLIFGFQTVLESGEVVGKPVEDITIHVFSYILASASAIISLILPTALVHCVPIAT